jgi:CRISPR type I-D-associated protein Csc2
MTDAVAMPKSLELLQQYFVEKPEPLLTNKTIQLVLIREVLDYLILRTEETRELNTVFTPRSENDDTIVERVAFLATKQKGAESRELGALLRTLNQRDGRADDLCYLKDRLCVKCPRCVLFGATSTERGRESRQPNIRHRIAYSTAFSLDPFEDIADTTTFNGVSEATTLTGQTLNVRHSVRPATLFPSIVTLQSVTWKELVLTLKTVWKSKRYGAETRIGGEVRNHLYGVVAGWEEVITPLEYTLSLAADGGTPTRELTYQILEKTYKGLASMKQQVRVFTVAELQQVTSEIQDFELSREFVEAAYQDATSFREFQAARHKEETGRQAR